MPKILHFDDFYADPNAVREFALASELFEPVSNVGLRTREAFIPDGTRERVEELLDTRISEWGATKYHGHVYATPADRPKDMNIHVDQPFESIVLLVYLSLKESDAAGNSLWRHKETGACDYDTSVSPDQFANMLKASKEMHEKGKWEKYDEVGFKYNRAVAFPPRGFHAGSAPFGFLEDQTARMFHRLSFRLADPQGMQKLFYS